MRHLPLKCRSTCSAYSKAWRRSEFTSKKVYRQIAHSSNILKQSTCPLATTLFDGILSKNPRYTSKSKVPLQKRLKSSATRLFVQLLPSLTSMKIPKFRIACLLWGEPLVTGVFKELVMRKAFLCHGVSCVQAWNLSSPLLRIDPDTGLSECPYQLVFLIWYPYSVVFLIWYSYSRVSPIGQCCLNIWTPRPLFWIGGCCGLLRTLYCPKGLHTLTSQW